MSRVLSEVGSVDRVADGQSQEPLVYLEHIIKIYRKPGSDVQVTALRGVTLAFQPGEYVAICGASGSGKSTLMNLIGCLDHPTTGRYLLDGEDISTLDDNTLSEIRSRKLGFVFQNFNLIPQLTVLRTWRCRCFTRASRRGYGTSAQRPCWSVLGWVSGCITGRWNFREANSNGRPSPGH